MPVFGNTNVGAEQTNGAIENRISGSVFTCPQNGEANSITAHILITDFTTKVKCAIYRADNYAFVGATEERSILRDAQLVGRWETFNFLGAPLLYGGTMYILVAWSEDQFGSAAYLNNTSIVEFLSVQMLATYATAMPSTFVPTRDPAHPTYPEGYYPRVASIYCDYTATGPPQQGTLTVHAKTA